MIPLKRAILHVVQTLAGGEEVATPVPGNSNGSAMVAIDGAVPVVTGSSFANSQITVTNVSQVLVAANANRKYLLIQNKDAAGIVYVTFNAAATAANGVRLQPNSSYELNFAVPVDSVSLIGDIASNANVVVVEG